ncbi:MAG: hypothetical protein J6C46_11980 [Clostridia bacterium]|nr:hypothetical protein [Clostridia bacterium]
MEKLKLSPDVAKNGNVRLRHKNISLDEKISLFEEYLLSTNEPLTAKTIYKGYKLGQMWVNVRFDFNNKTNSYTPQQKEKLENLGLLDKLIEKIDEKVDRLVKYCSENPAIWVDRRFYSSGIKDDRANIDTDFDVDSFKKALDDYEYLRVRKTKGKLSEEVEVTLREAGVGGVFGFRSSVQNLSEKTGIEPTLLNKIVCEFGSFEKFQEIYVEMMLNKSFFNYSWVYGNKDREDIKRFVSEKFGTLKKFCSFLEIFEDLAKEDDIVICFDLDAPDFIASKDVTALWYLASNQYVGGMFFDRQGFKSILNDLTEKEFRFLIDYMQSNGEKTFNEFASEFDLSRTRVGQIRDGLVKKLNVSYSRIWNSKLDMETYEKFIRTYFEHNSMFIKAQESELDLTFKEKCKKIINEKDKEEKDYIIDGKADQSSKVGSIHITKLGLSSRAEKGLLDEGCRTVSDIIYRYRCVNDFLKIKNCGNGCAVEIISKLRELGINLVGNELNMNDTELAERVKFEKERASSKSGIRLRNLISKLKEKYNELGEKMKRCDELRDAITLAISKLEGKASEYFETSYRLEYLFESSDYEAIFDRAREIANLKAKQENERKNANKYEEERTSLLVQKERIDEEKQDYKNKRKELKRVIAELEK